MKARSDYAAATLAPLIGPDDVIWVHDYHLIPLAAELRAMGCKQRIGFFLHIPMPPPLIPPSIQNPRKSAPNSARTCSISRSV